MAGEGEFKVGDRVVYVGKAWPFRVGVKGTIVESQYDSDSAGLYSTIGVLFDGEHDTCYAYVRSLKADK